MENNKTQGILATLDKKTTVSVLEKMIGFDESPVPIDTFIHDEYYLGNDCGYDYDLGYEKTYDVWRQALNELFPNPITMRSSFVCNTGAIGCVVGNTRIVIDNDKIISIRDLYENKKQYIGHNVKSFDIRDKIDWTSRINNIWYTGRKPIARIHFYGTDKVIECTYDHPFLKYGTEYFVAAQELKENDKIACVGNTYAEVMNVELTRTIDDVYDLTIDDTSNYAIYLDKTFQIYSHNTGKSNMAKIAILYLIYRMGCCKNFFAYNHLTPREIVIGVSHNTKEKADTVIKDFKDMMNNSPYFTEKLNDSDSLLSKYIKFVSCRAPVDFVGTNMPIWFGTELNDYKPQTRATELINAAISRIESRFRRSLNLFDGVFLDSSDRGVDSAVPIFLKENAYGRQALQFKFSHWEAKPGEYWHRPDKNRIDTYEFLYDSRGNKIPNENFGKLALSFRVYCGDSEIHPQIIDGEIPQEILEKMDPDRFIDVPNELRNSFEADIELALQEKCGRATETSSQYFNSQFVVPAFNIDNNVHKKYATDMHEDIITCSFFNDDDKYEDYLEDAIEMIPKNRSVFVAIDLGLSSEGDYAGFAIGYIEDIGERNNDGIITYDPIYKIPIAFGIGRYPGEETSIPKIIDMISWIQRKRSIHTVSTDRFQSYAIEQACLTMRIKHEFLSVDKYLTGWKIFKDALYRKKLFITKNNRLKNETLNVYYDEERNKVDHHEKLNAANDPGSNSKDILDACVRAVWNMFNAVNESDESLEEIINPKLSTVSAQQEMVDEYTNALSQMYLKQQFMRNIRH